MWPRCGRKRLAHWPRGAAWAMALGMAAGATAAAPTRGPRASVGARTPGPVVARVGDAQRRERPHDHRSVVLAGGCRGGRPAGVGRTTAPKDRTTAASRGDRWALSLRCTPTRGWANGGLTVCYRGKPTLILARMLPSPRPSLPEGLASLACPRPCHARDAGNGPPRGAETRAQRPPVAVLAARAPLGGAHDHASSLSRRGSGGTAAPQAVA